MRPRSSPLLAGVFFAALARFIVAAPMTGITEVTPAGEAALARLADQPLRYVLQSGGYKEIGRADLYRPIPPGNLEQTLRDALFSEGYAPAKDGDAANIALTFSWGVYALPAEYHPYNVIVRANFVAGPTFARALGIAVSDSVKTIAATPNVPDATFKAAVGVNQAAALTDPLRRFRDVSAKNDALYDQVMAELYYVVISAYDPVTIAARKPQLLWRTRLTVMTEGVSPEKVLPELIKAGAPLFGRKMDEAELLTVKATAAAKRQ